MRMAGVCRKVGSIPHFLHNSQAKQSLFYITTADQLLRYVMYDLFLLCLFLRRRLQCVPIQQCAMPPLYSHIRTRQSHYSADCFFLHFPSSPTLGPPKSWKQLLSYVLSHRTVSWISSYYIQRLLLSIFIFILPKFFFYCRINNPSIAFVRKKGRGKCALVWTTLLNPLEARLSWFSLTIRLFSYPTRL